MQVDFLSLVLFSTHHVVAILICSKGVAMGLLVQGPVSSVSACSKRSAGATPGPARSYALPLKKIGPGAGTCLLFCNEM